MVDPRRSTAMEPDRRRPRRPSHRQLGRHRGRCRPPASVREWHPMSTDAVTDPPGPTSSTTSTASSSTRSSGTSRVVAQPYAALGERLGISEAEVLERTRAGQGRRASCASSPRSSTPARSATRRRSSRRKIDPDHIDEAAAIISRHPGVSHNYKRNHAYNLWYTLAVPPGEDFDEHLDALHRESGALVTRKLPDAEALQDRREARHDRQDRGEREGRGARAREAGAPRRHGRARPERLGHRGHLHRAGGPAARRAPVRGAGREDRRHRGRSCSRRCSRSRTAS